MKNTHIYLDEGKRRMAKAVLQAADLKEIRKKSLANMDRWNASGLWVSAHDEWRELMTNGSDAEVIATMTGRDQKANRLRQSAPYAGIIDDVTRAYLWETRKVEEDADVTSAYASVDMRKLRQAKNLLRKFDVTVVRQTSLSFLERLNCVAGKLSPTHQEWHTLLTTGSDDEIVEVMTCNGERAIRLRLVHPFGDLLRSE